MERYVNEYLLMSETDIDYELSDAIKCNHSDRLLKFKASKYLGYDFNRPHYFTSLLMYATSKDDLVIAGYLAKNGADIYVKDEYGKNLIFFCIIENKIHLLKYFISCDVDGKLINEIYIGMSPVYYLLCAEKYDLAKMFINKNAKIITDKESSIFLAECVVNMDDDERKEFMDLIKLYFSSNSFTKSDKIWLNVIFAINDDELLLMIIKQNNNLHNMKYEKKIPVFAYAIENCMKQFVEYCIFNNLKFDSKLDETLYLYEFMNIGLYELSEHMVKKNPKMLTYISGENRNILDVIIGVNVHYKWGIKTEETIIKLLKLVSDYNYDHKLNIDIDNVNEYNIRPIDLAIQYGMVDVARLLIEQGCDITTKKKCKINSLRNDFDTLSYSIQHGRLKITELLLESGCVINTIKLKKEGINLCVPLLTAINFNEPEIFEYLIHHPRFSKYDNNYAYLLSYSIKTNIVDQKILKHLCSGDYLKTIQLEQNDNIIIRSICNIFEKYDITERHKLPAMRLLKECICVLKFMVTSDLSDKNEILDHITHLSDNICIQFMTLKMSSSADITYILYRILKFSNMNLLVKIFDIITDDMYNNKSRELLYCYITILKSYANVDAIINVYNALCLYLENKVVLNEIIVPEDFHKNKTETLLNKLSFPFKVNHYDIMYKLVAASFNTMCKESDAGFTIIVKNTTIPHITDKKNYFNILNESKKKVNVEYFVSKNICNKEWQLGRIDPKLQHPSNWFSYYGKNIGIDAKQDDNHMFPFGFDRVLQKCACYETKITDKYSSDKYGIQLYFDGHIKYNDVVINGKYEYFITHNGVLFHRLFTYSK